LGGHIEMVVHMEEGGIMSQGGGGDQEIGIENGSFFLLT